MGAVAHPPLPREDTAELLHEPFKGVARDLSNDQLHPCHSRATGLQKSRQSSANSASSGSKRNSSAGTRANRSTDAARSRSVRQKALFGSDPSHAWCADCWAVLGNRDRPLFPADPAVLRAKNPSSRTWSPSAGERVFGSVG